MDVSDQTPFRVMTAYIINSAQRQTAAVDHDAIKALLSLCRRPAGRPAEVHIQCVPLLKLC